VRRVAVAAEGVRALEQAGLVERLEALGDVEVLPSSCGEGSELGTEIMILVPSRAISDAVQRILRGEPFTVPVTTRKV